jgi:hypothetical protein
LRLPLLNRSSDSLYLLSIYLHFYTTSIFRAYLSSIACFNMPKSRLNGRNAYAIKQQRVLSHCLSCWERTPSCPFHTFLRNPDLLFVLAHFDLVFSFFVKVPLRWSKLNGARQRDAFTFTFLAPRVSLRKLPRLGSVCISNSKAHDTLMGRQDSKNNLKY